MASKKYLMQTIMPLLIAAQIFVSPKCLLRFTMSMPSLGLGGQVYGLVSALFPFILFVLFFFVFSACIWIWCSEAVCWAWQGSNPSVKSKNLYCSLCQDQSHSLHLFPFAPLTPIMCTFRLKSQICWANCYNCCSSQVDCSLFNLSFPFSLCV